MKCFKCHQDIEKCDMCGQDLPKAGDLSKLKLAALGLYDTQYMTLRGFKLTFPAIVASSSADLTSVTLAQQSGHGPFNLYQIPGSPVNAYPLLKDFVVIARLTGGVQPLTAFAAVLAYVDQSSQRNYIGAVAPALSLNGGQAVAMQNSTIIVSDSSFTSVQPKDLGSFVVEGDITLGGVTSVTLDLYFNFGVLYGVPA